MCGIVAVIDPRGGTAEALGGTAARMATAIEHRGPDDHGVWVDPDTGVALAHRRLSIVDVTPAGHQPMASASGRTVLTYNGELYNHLDLRRELERAGVVFRSSCDTEVLVEALEHWGLHDTLTRTNGMFALAAWDRSERTLHLARDRVGEKPLYYCFAGRVFLAASQPDALRAHPDFRAEIDRHVLAAYLRFGYVPEPWCIYRGVRTLTPGTSVSLRLGDAAAPEPRAFWTAAATVRAARAEPFSGSDSDAIDELDRRLARSVQMRMMSDVPLGAFLSGGIDSSTIVALMAALGDRPVRTFSIGSDDAGYDEAGDAAAVAHHLGTDHTELRVSADDARSVIPDLAGVYDEPFADPSQIPTLLVSRLARGHVTVALSGDGGDELFGGYNRYVLGRALWSRARHVPRTVRRAASAALRPVSATAWDRAHGAVARVLPAALRARAPGDKLAKAIDAFDARDPDDLYLRLVSTWPDPEAVARGAPEVPSGAHRRVGVPEFDDPVDLMRFRDLIGYIPGDSLVKLDRASMSVGLEARVPMLDPELVAWAWSLPGELVVRDGRGKWLLRQVLRRYVPDALVDRPKMGFDLPVGPWLRGPLREWAESLLDAERLSADGYLDPEPVRTAWSEHLAGSRNHEYRLWTVLMFQAWRDRVRL